MSGVFRYVAILDTIWAITFFFSISAYNTIPLLYLQEFLGGPGIVSTVLLFSSFCAIIALLPCNRHNLHTQVTLMIPQATVLAILGLGVIVVVATGIDSAGVPRPHLVILARQLPLLIISIMHTATFTRKFVLTNGN
jgi:hypothetical protein